MSYKEDLVSALVTDYKVDRNKAIPAVEMAAGEGALDHNDFEGDLEHVYTTQKYWAE